jgi:hypothetical protein
MQNRNSAWCDIDDTPLSLPREGAATVVLGYRRMNLLKVLCLRHIRKRPAEAGRVCTRVLRVHPPPRA